MAVVLRVVRGHKGAILLDSAVGRGTTTRVLFPLCEVERAAHAEVPAVSPSEPPMVGTVSVVDDEGSS
jgi:two-component system cell cycle sensor histidine kinase/response regulator CckA